MADEHPTSKSPILCCRITASANSARIYERGSFFAGWTNFRIKNDIHKSMKPLPISAAYLWKVPVYPLATTLGQEHAPSSSHVLMDSCIHNFMHRCAEARNCCWTPRLRSIAFLEGTAWRQLF